MVRFVIIRHGFSVTNKERRFTGQNDVMLTPEGFEQARQTAKYVLEKYNVDAVYSSDLMRAYDTVLPIAKAKGLEIKTTPDLREVNVGNWQGILVEDINKLFPEQYAAYSANPGTFTFEGGEKYSDVAIRAIKALEKIAAQNDGKTVVVGTHGGVMRNLVAKWTGVSPENMHTIAMVPNASVTEVVYNNGSFEIIRLAYADHLAQKAAEKGIN